jgi:hypothetical protein
VVVTKETKNDGKMETIILDGNYWQVNRLAVSIN